MWCWLEGKKISEMEYLSAFWGRVSADRVIECLFIRICAIIMDIVKDFLSGLTYGWARSLLGG
jgi:hypothetical protein